MAERTGAGEDSISEQLGWLVQSLAAAGRAALPGSPEALLHAIVEAAARIFGAGAASILLANEAEGVLEFKASCGASNRDLVGTRFPLDQGIAGYVAMTGQPIAISNVEQDTRFNRDFAKSTGYVPRSILATPLVAGDRVIGVMEVLDKIDAPSFGLQDMDLLALFAQQAALAIDLAQSTEHLGEALRLSLRRLAQAEGSPPADQLLAALAAEIEPGSQHDMLELAGLLYEFGQLGDDERKAALKVVQAFAEYGRARRRLAPGVSRR